MKQQMTGENYIIRTFIMLYSPDITADKSRKLKQVGRGEMRK
jgi:hypothetical protein